MTQWDSGPAGKGQWQPGPTGLLAEREDGGPFDPAKGFLAGIGLSLPAWLAAAAALPFLP
jgi:hypothetical protein